MQQFIQQFNTKRKTQKKKEVNNLNLYTMKKEFTFDIIREDSQDNKILIRYARQDEASEDKFDTLNEVKQCLYHHLKMNIYISNEIINF